MPPSCRASVALEGVACGNRNMGFPHVPSVHAVWTSDSYSAQYGRLPRAFRVFRDLVDLAVLRAEPAATCPSNHSIPARPAKLLG